MVLSQALTGSYNGTISDNYGMRWIDLPVSSPISITLQNISAGSQLRGSVVAETASGLVVTSFPTIISNGGSTSLHNFSAPAGTTRLIAVITNQTQTSNNPSVCSTGAYSLSLDTIPGKETYLPIIANYTSMTGQVTYRGTPLINTEVVLRYWDGFSWSTYDTVAYRLVMGATHFWIIHNSRTATRRNTFVGIMPLLMMIIIYGLIGVMKSIWILPSQTTPAILTLKISS